MKGKTQGDKKAFAVYSISFTMQSARHQMSIDLHVNPKLRTDAFAQLKILRF